MFVRLKNLKTGREFAANFSSKSEAEEWVKSHKGKGKDKQEIIAPELLSNAAFIEEIKGPFGKAVRQEIPAEYEVEYFEYNVNQIENYWKEFKDKRKQILKETDYTQLPDVPITTEERRHYRVYREYVRNKKNDYNDSNINRWKILSFEEFRQMKFPK